MYVWCPKSAYFKRQLRKYGTREDVVKAAKAAYLFHLSEAKHLKKYLGQAFDTATAESWRTPATATSSTCGSPSGRRPRTSP